jgi:hypothetical protein
VGEGGPQKRKIRVKVLYKRREIDFTVRKIKMQIIKLSIGISCTSSQLRAPESIATIPPFGPIEKISGLTRFSANESPRRTGLHSSLSAKSSFYLPAFEISRSCRTALELIV